MVTRKIDALEILKDIRAGMDDAAIMKKYNLNEQGLESMRKKLVELGIVRQLNAFEVLKDIRAGKDDEFIKRKYGLSRRGLQSVFSKLLDTGLLSQAELDNRKPTASSEPDTH